MESVKKLNDFLQPYYTLITALVFFGGIFIAAYKYLISPSDLKVIVSTEEVNYPSPIGTSMENIFGVVPEKDEKLKYDVINLYNFIISTTEAKTILIENEGDETLREISFKYLNTNSITGYSINSDFLNQDEESKLYQNLIYDEKRKITYLKELINLPPKKSITIKLWGNFKKSFNNDELIVTSSTDDGFIEETYTANGIRAILSKYFFEIFVLLIIVFFIIYHFSIKNIKEYYDKKNRQ